jgi:hypothetical protein
MVDLCFELVGWGQRFVFLTQRAQRMVKLKITFSQSIQKTDNPFASFANFFANLCVKRKIFL